MPCIVQGGRSGEECPCGRNHRVDRAWDAAQVPEKGASRDGHGGSQGRIAADGVPDEQLRVVKSNHRRAVLRAMDGGGPVQGAEADSAAKGLSR